MTQDEAKALIDGLSVEDKLILHELLLSLLQNHEHAEHHDQEDRPED